MHRFRRFSVFLLIFQLFYFGLLAQAPRLQMELFNTEDGLPDNGILSIHQDQLGYIWIGTRIGLVRYDGYEFISYQPIAGDDKSLQGKQIAFIHESANADLWIGTEWGLHYFDRGKEEFTNISIPHLNQNRQRNRNLLIHHIFEDTKGMIWIISDFPNYLYRWNSTTKTLTEVLMEDSSRVEVGKSHPLFQGAPMIEDEMGNLWIGSNGKGLLKYEKDSDLFIRVKPEENHLPCDTIYSLLLDEENLLWLGTPHGLARYSINNETFIPFTKGDPANGESIFDIRKDHSGNIWLQQAFELKRIEKGKEKAKSYFQLPEIGFNETPGTRMKYFVWIGEDSNGNIYWANPLNHHQIFSYDPIADQIKAITHEFTGKSGRWGTNNTSLFLTGIVDHQNRLWLGYTLGLLKVKATNTNFFTYKTEIVTRFAEDSYGRVWMGGSELLWLEENTQQLQLVNKLPVTISNSYANLSLLASNVSILHFDQNSNLWLGRFAPDFGIYKTELSNDSGALSNLALGKPVRASSIQAIPMHLPDFVVDGDPNTRWASQFKDPQWIEVDLEYSQYISYLVLHWETGSAKAYQIQLSDDGNKWRTVYSTVEGKGGTEKIRINTEGRYIKILGKERNSSYGYSIWEIEVFGRIPEPKHFQYIPGDQTSIPSNQILAILEDHQGRLWHGTQGGLTQYIPEKDNFITIKLSDIFQESELYPFVVDNIFEDKRGIMWLRNALGSYFTFDPKQNLFEKFNPDLQDSSQIPLGKIFEQNNGTLWVTSPRGGMYRYKLKEDQRDFYLPDQFITSFLEDKAGNIWLGTGNGGLFKMDSETESWTNYPLKAFPSISQIQEDQQGRLWIGTSLGLICFSPKDEKFEIYDREDGLFGKNVVSSFKDSRGNLYFGGQGGFSAINPDDFKSDTSYAKIIISDLKFGGVSVKPGEEGSPLSRHISLTSSIELDYDQNAFSLEFTSLHYTNSEANQYRVKMIGVDTAWIDLGSQRNVNYAGLSPGDYTVQVLGSNADGIWSKEPATLNIIINPPWWLSIWAYIFYGLLTGVAIWAFLQWRTRETRKELEAQQQLTRRLQQVDKLKDQFLANTSHELRTPLQGIIGLSESLAERVEASDQKEDLSMIVSSGKRLNNLVNDILDFSKLRNFDIELSQKVLDLRTIVDIVLKNHIPLIKGKEVELVNAVPNDGLAVLADENRLQQILYNLVGNAVKFTEKGKITVGVSLDVKNPDSEMAIISVTDTGIGIPENKREAIFREFQQADGSISREFAGTGLGLSISKKLVELHRGKMWVESEIGKGSTFFFSLPVSSANATQLRPISGTTPSLIKPNEKLIPHDSIGKDRGGVRILIVDDEPINHQVLKNHLSNEAYHLIQAMNGEEAIAAIDEHGPFDLILLDVMMPRMSGYEVCQQIREKFLSSELPIIMITAKNQLQDIVQGLSTGANDYLAKPFHKEELIARINTQLDLHRINSVTSKFVPNEFLRSLGLNRITEVALGDQIQKDVTVLFTDIRDYTSLSETMTPEENFKFVNAFHGRMGPVIQKYGGFVNQYLGDAIMAIFPDQPENALRAAAEMQQCLKEYNLERTAIGRKALKMGIGVHTGPLIMGIIGDQNRMDAATISDTVNTASRIESLTKYYNVSILISERSLIAMDDSQPFNTRYLGKVKVKGKKKPVGIYECLDGDDVEIKELKQKTAREFEKGLNQFFSRKFAEAVASFDQVVQVNPKDKVATLFLNKAALYIRNGVPENWTGIESMEAK